MERKATTSITHLVKMVAEEVVKEEIGKLYETLHERSSEHIIVTEKRLAAIEQELCLCDIPDIPEDPPAWTANNAGAKWTREQEEALIKDYALVVAWIARRQGRSAGSISSRLRDLMNRHYI